jgi:hypothetical protein
VKKEPNTRCRLNCTHVTGNRLKLEAPWGPSKAFEEFGKSA